MDTERLLKTRRARAELVELPRDCVEAALDSLHDALGGFSPAIWEGRHGNTRVGGGYTLAQLRRWHAAAARLEEEL